LFFDNNSVNARVGIGIGIAINIGHRICMAHPNFDSDPDSEYDADALWLRLPRAVDRRRFSQDPGGIA
jgi:hypothetical protein